MNLQKLNDYDDSPSIFIRSAWERPGAILRHVEPPVPSESIGECGRARCPAKDWITAELKLGICYIRPACVEPPTGYEPGIIRREYDVGQDGDSHLSQRQEKVSVPVLTIIAPIGAAMDRRSFLQLSSVTPLGAPFSPPLAAAQQQPAAALQPLNRFPRMV